MADESLHTIPLEHNIDYHIVTLFERLEAMRKDGHGGLVSGANNRLSNNMQPKRSMQAEIRTLEFWRSIISECLASFFYVFIVCGAAAGAGVGASVSSVLLATSLASGLAMATLTQCFLHISGAHINPAVTLASCVIRSVSPIRAAMYITAQCGGGIAGAALLYGVTVPGYQGNLQAAISHSASLAAWERFGVEFILTFIVVLTYFVSTDSYKKYIGNSALSIGAAYSACSFVSMPYLNPARSLGPSFVLNKWDNHWVYWFGPLVGGITSGIIYEYIFNSRRSLRFMSKSGAADNDSSSIHSDDDLNYDLDVDKPHKYQQGHGTYQRGKPVVNAHHVPVGGVTMGTMGGGNYCQNLYTAPPPLGKFEQPEPLYGGTRSMYCRSPTLTRSNLNRSQSVYAKSNTAINRDIVPRPGPLVPAQSLYPMRVSQQQAHQAAQSHLQNQNVQNQLQQRSESIYGLRTATRNQQQQQQQQQHHNQQMSHQQQQHQHQHHQQQQQQQMPHHSASTDGPPPVFPAAVYGSRQNPNPMDGNLKFERRPESVYGMTTVPRNRGQSAQSDDSSYGSYHGSAVTPPARNTNGEPLMMYVPPPQPVQSQQQQQHQQQQQQQQQQAPPSTQQVMRTQSERKVSAPVVVSSHQTVPPPMSMTYTNSQVNSPTPVTTSANSQQQQQQQQQQQAQMLQQQTQNQQQPHYGVMSMRPN